MAEWPVCPHCGSRDVEELSEPTLYALFCCCCAKLSGKKTDAELRATLPPSRQGAKTPIRDEEPSH